MIARPFLWTGYGREGVNDMSDNLNLAEAYPKEQERCRELLEVYKQINTGGFGVLVIGDILERSEIAAANQDTVEMIRLYQEMRDCQ